MMDEGLLRRRFGGLCGMTVVLLRLEIVWGFVALTVLTVLFSV